MEKEKKIIELSIEWITRLKYYTDRVRNTTENELEHKMAIIALLGYLDGLGEIKNQIGRASCRERV